MRVIELTVSVTRKMNLGNYESKDFFGAVKMEVESGDDVWVKCRETFRTLAAEVEQAALEAVARIAEEKEAKKASWNAEHGVRSVG